MSGLELETRPLYGIGTVSRLTGIKADTLRVWERRYGLGPSRKSATGRREYTQSELEHLQIVAALISSGNRIGEIACRDRRTLEMMYESGDRKGLETLPKQKPKVLFIGGSLAQWLDSHQGCIAGVSAMICRQSLAEYLAAVDEPVTDLAAIVVESDAEGWSADYRQQLYKLAGSAQLIVCHGSGAQGAGFETQGRVVSHLAMPPEPVAMGRELNRAVVQRNKRMGEGNAGELAVAKPREFSAAQLGEAAAMNASLACECPGHLAKLISQLNEFEEYTTQCEISNWDDAAVHACIYAYTNQARWLMEKALQAVIEESR